MQLCATRNKKLKIKKLILDFFLVFYPIRPFQTIQFMTIIGILLAIGVVVKKLGIPMPAFRTRLSFGWLTVMVAGWFFGPVYGFVYGIISDSLILLTSPGTTWF